jgi:DNA-binding XRE family transcriptional regulator
MPSLAMRDWKAIVAKNVRKLRQQRKLTQEQLAFQAEIDLNYLGGIERGRRNPSPELPEFDRSFMWENITHQEKGGIVSHRAAC